MSFWAGRRVLVTGGAGFIGSHVVEQLLALGAVTTVVDNLSKGKLATLIEIWKQAGFQPQSGGTEFLEAGPHRFLRIDLRNREDALPAMEGQEAVIHLAATIGGRGFIERFPAECCANFAVNSNLFSQAAATGVERVLYASTACVYPVSLQSEYASNYLLKEEDAWRDGWASCDREYGWAKFMGELELTAYCRQKRLKGSIVRYVTAYGPREDESHAVIALIRRALRREDPYVVWGSGEQDRDFTFVDDIVSGTLLACEKITDATPVNLGTARRYRIKDVARMILEEAGHEPKNLVFDRSQPEGVATRALDVSRARELLGWEAGIPLREGIRRTVNWCSRNSEPLLEEALATRPNRTATTD